MKINTSIGSKGRWTKGIKKSNPKYSSENGINKKMFVLNLTTILFVSTLTFF